MCKHLYIYIYIYIYIFKPYIYVYIQMYTHILICIRKRALSLHKTALFIHKRASYIRITVELLYNLAKAAETESLDVNNGCTMLRACFIYMCPKKALNSPTYPQKGPIYIH